MITADKLLSPSAFIPFCAFGGNMSAVGQKIQEFDIPVCTTFQAKILNDQLCYEVDLNKISNNDNIHNELQLGLTFIMDYNEDRQITFDQIIDKASKIGFASSTEESDKNQQAFIYLNTIGRYNFVNYCSISTN